MAKTKEKEEAIKLRLQGLSYSDIKSKLRLSKSTLSVWLRDYPLSEKQLEKLKDKVPQQVERCRNTKEKKYKARLDDVYNKISKDISKLSNREILIAGLFLYWGEGSKSERYTCGFSNTDPSMVRFFLKWLRLFNIENEKLHITLQLYSDMDVNKEIKFWSHELDLPTSCFRRPYIKKSTLSGLIYKRGFGHGTCFIRIFNRDLAEYIHMGIKRISLMDF